MMLFALVTVIRFLYLYTRTKKLFASFINGLKFIIRKKINNKKYDPSYPLALMHIVYTYIYLGKKLFLFYSGVRAEMYPSGRIHKNKNRNSNAKGIPIVLKIIV